MRERAYDVAAHIMTDALRDHGDHEGWYEEKVKAAELILAALAEDRAALAGASRHLVDLHVQPSTFDDSYLAAEAFNRLADTVNELGKVELALEYCGNECKLAMDKAIKAEAREAALREALNFYAGTDEEGLDCDGGDTARAALAGAAPSREAALREALLLTRQFSHTPGNQGPCELCAKIDAALAVKESADTNACPKCGGELRPDVVSDFGTGWVCDKCGYAVWYPMKAALATVKESPR